jgi:hypothetical protein
MDRIDRPGEADRALGALCGAFGGMLGLALVILALPILLAAIYVAGGLLTMLTR